MFNDDEDEPGPGRKSLKDKLYRLKTSRRSGAYTSDPNNQSRGIFKDPDKSNQKAYREKMTEQIKKVKAQMRGS